MKKPRNSVMLALVAGALLLASSASMAGEPVKNVRRGRHPNLAAAQKYSQLAYKRLIAAQKANEFDMDGHAQKAKDLLEQANSEIKQAAEAANHNRR